MRRSIGCFRRVLFGEGFGFGFSLMVTTGDCRLALIDGLRGAVERVSEHRYEKGVVWGFCRGFFF